MGLRGGRSWWAHFEFTRINTTPTILPKKFEDVHEARATLVNAAAFVVSNPAFAGQPKTR